MLLHEQRHSFGEYTDYLVDAAVAHIVSDVEMPVDLVTALLAQGIDVEQLVISTVREMYSGAEVETDEEDELDEEFVYTLH
jgi:hypothetical protein